MIVYVHLERVQCIKGIGINKATVSVSVLYLEQDYECIKTYKFLQYSINQENHFISHLNITEVMGVNIECKVNKLLFLRKMMTNPSIPS